MGRPMLMSIVFLTHFTEICLGQSSTTGIVYLRSPPLSCSDIQFIVDFHNNGRRALANGTLPGQPKAANMQKMVWDTRLAEVATNWTKKMIFGHNPDRHNDSRFSVGENLFMTATTNVKNTKVEWHKPMLAWFNEYMIYYYEPAFDDPLTGHYTQMIWADVIHVGCGTSQFLNSRNWLMKYYVCNYGPSGNFYGDYPYLTDDGINEFEILKSLGLLPPDAVNPTKNCDNLCCDVNQCTNIYGPKCSQK